MGEFHHNRSIVKLYRRNSWSDQQGFYRGNVGILPYKHSDKNLLVKRGVAQLIRELKMYPEIIELAVVDVTGRNYGEFDSTGV